MQFGDFPNTAANYILIETTRANFCCLPSKTLTDKTYLARNFREPIGLAKVMTLGSRVLPEPHCPHPSSSFGCPSCVEILPWLPRTLPQSPVCQQPLRAGPRAEHIVKGWTSWHLWLARLRGTGKSTNAGPGDWPVPLPLL